MRYLSCAAPHHTTDLALHATKQTAAVVGRSMAVMVEMERHLWVNLADIREKEKGFLLAPPISPSELFGNSVEAVVENFREARALSVAFRSCILGRTCTQAARGSWSALV